MNFLINCSNLKNGGGLQVADSLYRELYRFKQHNFYVVLSSMLGYLGDLLPYDNIHPIIYNLNHSFRVLAFGRDKFLDSLVADNHIDAVLTVFGPSLWRPKCKHLCGFARAQLLLTDSPYYKTIGLKTKIVFKIWEWAFINSSKIFYTENSYISEMLPSLMGDIKVFTVTNYYNQIFDDPNKWGRQIKLDSFDGTTLISVSSIAEHKNLKIMVPISSYLKKKYPEFRFRFVLTCDETPFIIPKELRSCFVFVGKVDVKECPYLYEQSDIMFMPSLMECFSATYPEAMRMEIPIITTDLEFARGLCGDAACYYSAVNEDKAAEAIYKVATDKKYADQLVTNGKEQLKSFDDYSRRANKLVRILEELVAGNG